MGKTVAVMQPYIFPYIGYFQLIDAADTFVFYDDVNFIKQGWINRNKVLGTNTPITFTIPLKSISSFKLIKDTEINTSLYLKWLKKFLKTLEQTYKKAPYYRSTFELISDILKEDTNNISELSIKRIQVISDYLELGTEFILSSEEFNNSVSLERTERLFHICNDLKAESYINSIGGKALYRKEEFAACNLELKFLKPNLKPYSQFSNTCILGLSIIDVLMFNTKEEVLDLIKGYQLI